MPTALEKILAGSLPLSSMTPMLRLIELLRREPDFPIGRVAFMVAVSGLAGGALLVAITLAAAAIARHEPDPQPVFVALVLLALTIYAQHDFLIQMDQAVEEVLLKLRLRIGNLLRHADLRRVEDTGTAALHATLAQDTQMISQAAPALALMARSALAALACLVYLGWISLSALLTALAFVAVYAFVQAAFIYPGLTRKLADNQALERVFFRRSKALFGGFKEIQLSRRKSDGLFEYYGRAAGDSSAGKRAIGTEIAHSFTLGYSAFYLLLIVLALVIPGLDGALSGRVFTLTAGALFIVSELDPWLTWIPGIVRADAVLEALCRLEQALIEASGAEPAARPPEPPLPFARLRLEDVRFQYGDDHGQSPVAVGPFDLVLNRGELLFITGGTGSGKTTLLKLLAGLYQPQSGMIRVDDNPVGIAGVAGYRELFAAVFTDGYLFDRLYGLPDADPARIRQWLQTMGLSGKTAFAEGGFTRRNLSSGERKRLAFIAAVLEDKPVLLVDEFTGDQDPEFRDRFYREILQNLKRRGTTLVVVTQDDRYFGLADRVAKMADGKLISG